MTKACALIFMIGAAVACEKATSSGTTSVSTSSAAPAVASASGAPSASGSAETPVRQRGLAAGEVVRGWVKDDKDEGLCSAIPGKPEPHPNYAALDEVAGWSGGKLVESCPMEHIVGACDMAVGGGVAVRLIVNYTAPKYDVASAKKHCQTNHGKWYD